MLIFFSLIGFLNSLICLIGSIFLFVAGENFIVYGFAALFLMAYYLASTFFLIKQDSRILLLEEKIKSLEEKTGLNNKTDNPSEEEIWNEEQGEWVEENGTWKYIDNSKE